MIVHLYCAGFGCRKSPSTRTEWARWIGAVVRPVARRGPPRFDHYLNVAEFKLLYVTCGANPKDGWRSFVRFQRADPNPTGIEEGGGGRPLRHQLK